MATLRYFSDLWSAALPDLADHLWQSTLFAAVAALVALSLRKHSARIRYTIWLAASLKFLVPFSLFVALGSWIGPRHIAALANPGVYIVYIVEGLTQPFTQPPPQLHPTLAAVNASTSPIHWRTVMLALWLCGFIAVLSIWIVRWWHVAAAQRRASALSEGREVSALRRLECATGMQTVLKLLLSPALLEPGVFGIFHPVLLWPESISQHLDDSHLDSILAHELCHVRRQDNLAATLHMLVESLFWFHPLVWWMGARLIEEREQACDEAVIEMGSRRNTYAESILKVCEFCLSSPLTCVSGVTGSDLKKRMVHIMTDRIVPKLTFSRKLLLWTAACLALVLPIIFGLFHPVPGNAQTTLTNAPRYVNVSIQPHPEDTNGVARTKIMMSLMDSTFTARGVSAETLMQLAYHIQNTQFVNAPDWLGSAKFDIDAKVDKAAAEQVQKLTENQRGALGGQMLQGLLADQFKLKVHQESRDLPAYELTIAESGSKLQKQSDDKHSFMHLGTGELSSGGTSLSLLAAQLSMRLGRTVVDKTGLSGNYAYSLHWTPDADEHARMQQNEPIAPDTQALNNSAPPLLTAVQEQLGLTLQPVTTRVQVLIVDHVEQPSQQ